MVYLPTAQQLPRLRDGELDLGLRNAPGPDVRDLLFAVASGQGVTVAPRSVARELLRA